MMRYIIVLITYIIHTLFKTADTCLEKYMEIGLIIIGRNNTKGLLKNLFFPC